MKKLIPGLVCFLYTYFCFGQNLKKPDQLNDGIQTATLKEVGLNEKMIEAMVDSIVSGNYPNIHSVLILRNNKLVYENYWPGYDEIRTTDFKGIRNNHRDSLHDIRSVTKSIVSAAVMIALGKGKIKSLDLRVFDFFPEYAMHDTGLKRQITIQHVLNMSAGWEWDEYIPYSDPGNSHTIMVNTPDPIAFVLSQKMVDEPGKKFNYCSGATELLAAIVEKATEMPIDKFVEHHLFTPVGIEQYNWMKNKNGKHSAAAGLRLRSRDMVKFGMLYMNDGKWKDKQIIPAFSVMNTLKSQISTPFTDSLIGLQVGYSNQFWHVTEIIKGDISSYANCDGNGGQLIIHNKEYGLLLIVTAGNYNRRDLRKYSSDIYTDFVYPAIIKKY